MSYNIQRHELTLEINGSLVKLTFESDVPETSIWHYIFSALADNPLLPVQQIDTPIE